MSISKLAANGGCYITIQSAESQFSSPLYKKGHVLSPGIIRRTLDAGIALCERRQFSVVISMPNLPVPFPPLLVAQIHAIFCSLGMSAYALTTTALPTAFSRRLIKQLPCLLTPTRLQKEARLLHKKMQRTLYAALIIIVGLSLGHHTLARTRCLPSPQPIAHKKSAVPGSLLASLTALCPTHTSIDRLSFPPLHLVATSTSLASVRTLQTAVKRLVASSLSIRQTITLIPGAPTAYQLVMTSKPSQNVTFKND